MGHKLRGVAAGVIVGVLALPLANCVTGEAQDTEDTLAAAGFQVRYADTPEKLSHLKSLTQLRLVAHPYGDNVRYVFADAEGCKCLYAGDEAAYDRYQKMRVDEETAALNEEAAMDWSMWQPWDPYPW